MSVAGLCEICETRTIEHGCDRCGRLVCERHFDHEMGLCTACVAEVGRGPGGGGRPARRPGNMPDGVDTYRY